MNPQCHICRTQTKFLMEKDGYKEYICPACSLSFVYPQPEAEWLKDKIYSTESGYQGNKKSDLSLASISKRYEKTLDFLASKKPGGKLLDVGCSSGQFMYWAKERGFMCSGVEINHRTADIAIQNGFNVFKGFLENASFDKKSFDVVYLGDVIEHVTDPRFLVEIASSFLKEDGILVFSTPNIDCFWSKTTFFLYKIFRVPWSSLTPPHHLFQFNRSNLRRLVEEKNFTETYSIFTPPSSLKYEWGSLHLYKRYKNNKNFFNLSFMFFAFGAYALAYYVNILLGPFLEQDFQMAVFYEKNM